MAIRGRDGSHFVPSDISSDVFVERRKLAVAPIFVKDIKPQRVALDDEVVERRHRVRVVTGAADHAAQLVSNLLDNEELFRRADPETEPHTDDIFLREF